MSDQELAQSNRGARLAGRVAVITGGARGQGLSHGERLAADGATVVLADVLDIDGEKAASRLAEAGLAVAYVHLDVTSAEQWQNVLTDVVDRHGRLDILVNNAGVVRLEGLLDESEAGWQTVTAVNQTGVFLGMKHAVPFMVSGGGGSIVNIASVWGLVGTQDHIAYLASKGAVIAMTKGVAASFGTQGIRANTVCPGLVDTPMAAVETDESNDEAIAASALRRIAQPREISEAVAFLASDASSYITGTDLVVDGGVMAQ
jgi:NAD(P)-dependent dehydrogenase (short-subunit alcohol dehydrogenase family)